MNTNVRRSLCALTLVATTLSPVSATANATPSTHAAYTTTLSQHGQTNSVKEAINRLGPYVEYHEDEIVLDAPRDVIDSINPDIFDQINAGLRGMNQQIREGKISVAAIKAGRFQSRDAGENSVTAHWWGYNIKLSNDTFNRLTKVGIGIGSATGILAAMVADGVITIPASIPIGTIAAVIIGAVGILQPCNWNDRGVQLRYMFVGLPHCWPQ